MYVFDNAAPAAGERLSAIAELHDPGSMRHFAARGVARGWTCLEIGGGLGTITRWLSERVGPVGRVLTTDIDTRFLDSLQLANVDVRRHDIMAEALPDLDRISKTAAALRRVAVASGADLGLGLSLTCRLRAHGLQQIGNEGRVRVCRGGSSAARLARLNFEQLRDEMLATGELTIEEFVADLARLDDEDFAWRSPTQWTAWGRKPERLA